MKKLPISSKPVTRTVPRMKVFCRTKSSLSHTKLSQSKKTQEKLNGRQMGSVISKTFVSVVKTFFRVSNSHM